MTRDLSFSSYFMCTLKVNKITRDIVMIFFCVSQVMKNI